MQQKMKLKDWVRQLEEQGFLEANSGRCVPIQLVCLATGDSHSEPIPEEYWNDWDFRQGYEDLRADQGFRMSKIEICPSLECCL